MKNLFRLLGLITILFVSCKKESVNIQGAWEMVYQKFTSPDTSIINNFHRPQIKIFSKSYFSFGSQENDGCQAGGGRYTLEGNKYIESIIYFTESSYVDRKLTFTLEFKNDTLYQYGVIDSVSKITVLDKFVRAD
jgi:hypothetical protein